MLGTLAEHGLEAFVTLHHFTNPLWFAQRGGWASRDAVERFERYCEVVARELGDLMPWACTINEPQVFGAGAGDPNAGICLQLPDYPALPGYGAPPPEAATSTATT